MKGNGTKGDFAPSGKQTMDIMRSRPELSDWWIEQEKRTGKTVKWRVMR